MKLISLKKKKLLGPPGCGEKPANAIQTKLEGK